MAGVHAQNGRLLLTFQFTHAGRRFRCREFLHLDDCRDNRRLAARLSAELERDLAAGRFDYAARFPLSRNLVRLGLQPHVPPALPSLAAYAFQWLAAQRAHLRPSTFYDYTLIVRKHLAPPPLGARLLDQVTHLELENWLLGLKQAGLGPRRINMALARVRSIFRLAEEQRLIPRSPARHIRALREPRAAVDPFNRRECVDLIGAASSPCEQALLATLLGTGLRPSEALALRWSDLDLKRSLLCVRGSRSRYGVGMTKTAASEREVDLGPLLVYQLRRYAALPRRAPWLFVGARGKPLDWTNFRTRRWPALLAAAGVRPRPPYQCRHTYATTLLATGANPQYVAHQLGHSSLAMVIRHYARWTHKPESAGALTQAGL
ncbi:MAG TPA: tyrosine-type recombinase/integrase [Candidatus Binataceae bacterium]|nr:tyrosine-type recombinase/integrase [Candidatus Binataceae bacterium]